MIIGGAGLAGEVLATKRCGARCRTRAGDILQHAVHEKGVARIQYPQGFIASKCRLRLGHDIATVIDDALDDVGLDLVAAIGEHTIATHHLPQCHRTGTQCHGEIGRVLFGIEAKACDVVLRVLRADGLEDADRHHVLRFCDGGAHAHRTFELAIVVLRLPDLTTGQEGVDHHRSVIDDAGRGEAFLQRCRIDKGLERRSRLAPGLGDMVVLVATKVETAHHGANGAVLRIHRDESALGLGQLRNLPCALVVLLHSHDGAAPDAACRNRLVVQHARGELKALASDGDDVAAAAVDLDLLGTGFQHQRYQQVVAVQMILQRFFVGFIGVVGQFGKGFRSAIAVALVVVQ